MPVADPPAAATRPPDHSDRAMKSVTVLAGVLLLIAVGLIWLIVRQQNLASQTACQVRYNRAFATAQAKRAALNDADRTATLTLINQVFTPPRPGETQAQEQAAFRAYYQAYKSAEAAVTAGRAANKIPAVPDC